MNLNNLTIFNFASEKFDSAEGKFKKMFPLQNVNTLHRDFNFIIKAWYSNLWFSLPRLKKDDFILLSLWGKNFKGEKSLTILRLKFLHFLRRFFEDKLQKVDRRANCEIFIVSLSMHEVKSKKKWKLRHSEIFWKEVLKNKEFWSCFKVKNHSNSRETKHCVLTQEMKTFSLSSFICFIKKNFWKENYFLIFLCILIITFFHLSRAKESAIQLKLCTWIEDPCKQWNNIKINVFDFQRVCKVFVDCEIN